MAHKKLILTAAFVTVASSATFGGAVFAHGGNHHKAHTAHATTMATTEDVEAPLSATQKRAVDDRKAEIKQRIEAKRAEASTKLADKRLAACEKRQTKVNNIFTKATDRNKKHLAVFQKIEERVREFYATKNLSAEGYEAAVANADAKEAVAVAAIEASSEVTFDCASTDAAKPGAAIKEAMQVRHAALKDYRTAVKDLILVVKKHHGQQQNGGTDTATDQSGTDEAPSSTGTGATETETETEGVQ